MEKIVYEQLKETLYYEKLPNGLDVYILPKQGFNKTFATFTTKYGSVDNTFVPLGKEEMIRVPDGIAHFLEHKLFEKKITMPSNCLVNKGIGKCFHIIHKNSLPFSCTSNVEQNLNTLLNFVQEPYFSEKQLKKRRVSLGKKFKCIKIIQIGAYILG